MAYNTKQVFTKINNLQFLTLINAIQLPERWGHHSIPDKPLLIARRSEHWRCTPGSATKSSICGRSCNSSSVGTPSSGRLVELSPFDNVGPAAVRHAQEESLNIKGDKLLNLLPQEVGDMDIVTLDWTLKTAYQSLLFLSAASGCIKSIPVPDNIWTCLGKCQSMLSISVGFSTKKHWNQVIGRE